MISSNQGGQEMHYYIHAAKFILASGLSEQGFLEIIEGKFGKYTKTRPVDIRIVDLGESIVAPGLVDTHIHGYNNHDVMDNDFTGLNEISKGLLSCGVTAFLPTTLTAGAETLNEICKMISSRYKEVKGARIKGIFFEGPFFTTEHKGAQNPRFMSDPSLTAFRRWQDSAQGLLKKIALAPERHGAADFIENVSGSGTKVAIGHSSATYEEALEAVYAGANIFVHTFNGMSGLNHHAPGMVGAAMDTPNTYAELICDGHHVESGAANLLIQEKSVDHVALVTDCMSAGGMPAGEYVLGEFPVIVKDGAARLKDGGSLAGSVLKLLQAVQNLVQWGRVSLYDAFKMASYVPAVSVGIEDECGLIAAGREADFIVVDENINLQSTFLAGKEVYSK